jgi:hypothetical protein
VVRSCILTVADGANDWPTSNAFTYPEQRHGSGQAAIILDSRRLLCARVLDFSSLHGQVVENERLAWPRVHRLAPRPNELAKGGSGQLFLSSSLSTSLSSAIRGFDVTSKLRIRLAPKLVRTHHGL